MTMVMAVRIGPFELGRGVAVRDSGTWVVLEVLFLRIRVYHDVAPCHKPASPPTRLTNPSIGSRMARYVRRLQSNLVRIQHAIAFAQVALQQAREAYMG